MRACVRIRLHQESNRYPIIPERAQNSLIGYCPYRSCAPLSADRHSARRFTHGSGQKHYRYLSLPVFAPSPKRTGHPFRRTLTCRLWAISLVCCLTLLRARLTICNLFVLFGRTKAKRAVRKIPTALTFWFRLCRFRDSSFEGSELPISDFGVCDILSISIPMSAIQFATSFKHLQRYYIIYFRASF